MTEDQAYISFSQLDQIVGGNAPFLLSMSDGLAEELRLVISAGVVGEIGSGIQCFDSADEETNQIVCGILQETRPVEPDETFAYELLFENYIMYQIRNESYVSYDPYEIRRGKYLIVFERSRLLDHLSTVTDAQRFSDGSYYPDEWKHYGIYTQNHIIDVIACEGPSIRKIEL